MNDRIEEAMFVVPSGGYGVADIGPCVFLAERDLAFAADAPTGMIALCSREAVGVPWPATTPTMLARYLIVRAGEDLAHRFQATSEVYHVIRGAGSTRIGSHDIDWRAGDSFTAGGGVETLHHAQQDAILFAVTNEPELLYARTIPDPDAEARPLFFGADDLAASLGSLEESRKLPKAVMMVNRRMEPQLGIGPTLSVAFNTLPVGQDQAPHRHSAAALTLGLIADGMYSLVDGERVDWADGAVFFTPPNAVHSHHNRGERTMRSFVVQDGPLHAQLRTSNLVFGGG